MDNPKKLYLRQMDNLFKDVRILTILQGKTNVNFKAGSERTASFEEWLLMLSTALLCGVRSPVWLRNPTDYSPPGSSVHGIFQTRILEWAAISFSRETSQSRDQTHISSISCIGGQSLYQCAIWEVPCLAPASLNILSHSSLHSIQFSPVVQLCLTLRPHGLQHARLPCPSPTLGVYSNSCPSSWWCHPTITSSVVPFSSLLQSFPASGSFPISEFLTSGGQSIGVSASTSVLPMNTQDWLPLGLTGLISLQSKGLLRVFSNTIVQKHQFFCAQLSLQSNSHIHTRLLEKP